MKLSEMIEIKTKENEEERAKLNAHFKQSLDHIREDYSCGCEGITCGDCVFLHDEKDEVMFYLCKILDVLKGESDERK